VSPATGPYVTPKELPTRVSSRQGRPAPQADDRDNQIGFESKRPKRPPAASNPSKTPPVFEGIRRTVRYFTGCPTTQSGSCRRLSVCRARTRERVVPVSI